MSSLPTFGKRKLMGLIGVLSFGFTALFAVLGLGVAVPATFVTGFFILWPLVYVLGEDFPLVESDTESDADDVSDEDPVETLRRRYATGEIDDTEFERRLDRLLETEEIPNDRSGGSVAERTDRETDRELELN